MQCIPHFLPIGWLTNCTTTQRKTAAGLVKRIADRELLEALLNMGTFHNSLISLLFVFLVCVQQEQPVKVMLLLCRSAAALQFHRQSWSRLPSSLLPTASPCCGNVLCCTERAQLPKKKVHAENLNLVYMKPSAFKLLAVSPQVEEAIWFPCILSRKNFRYHLFFRGLKLTCVYLKTSACLANTNMQLWFSGTHYLTSWYVPRG